MMQAIKCDNCGKMFDKKMFVYRVIGRVFWFCSITCRKNKVREL